MLDEGTELSLEKIKPTPKSYLGNNEIVNGVIPRWYDWRVENWGTKWDIDAQLIGRLALANGLAEIQYSFESAWSPPEEAIRYVSQRYSSLEFNLSYDEPGMNFAGYCIYQNGLLIEHDTYDSIIAGEWNEEEEELI